MSNIQENYSTVYLPYAGIGSRQTPQPILDQMTHVGALLGLGGWLLRSGGAQRADTAFELGCNKVNGAKEIYLPWANFQGNPSRLFPPSEAAIELASQVHPAWHKCSSGAKLLHARNCHQILGIDLTSPVKFCLCWTPFGETRGGTGTAIRLCERFGIQVINMNWPNWYHNLQCFVYR